MNEVGRFSRKPSDVINTVTDMVVHDMKAMQDNIGALDGMKLGDGNAIVIGSARNAARTSMRRKTSSAAPEYISRKQVRKMEKPSSPRTAPATFPSTVLSDQRISRRSSPTRMAGKSPKKGKDIAHQGNQEESGDGTYPYLTLNRETWIDMQFPSSRERNTKVAQTPNFKQCRSTGPISVIRIASTES